MPELDGIQATWLVSGRAPRSAIVIVTSEKRMDFMQHVNRQRVADGCNPGPTWCRIRCGTTAAFRDQGYGEHHNPTPSG
jgi:hypothetical protein